MPAVKLANQPYERPFFPPVLQWFKIYRGEESAGELLAAFELLEVIYGILTIKVGLPGDLHM